MIDLGLSIVWIAAIGYLLFLGRAMWSIFVENHPLLHRGYVPDGKWYLIPYKQFARAYRAEEVRKVFRTDPELRWRIRMFFFVLAVYCVLIPKMLHLLSKLGWPHGSVGN